MQQRSPFAPCSRDSTRAGHCSALPCGGQMRHDCPVAAAHEGMNRIDCIAVTGSCIWDTHLQSCQLDCAAHQVCTDLSASLSRGVWFFARCVNLQCWATGTQQAQAELRLLLCLLWITLAKHMARLQTCLHVCKRCWRHCLDICKLGVAGSSCLAFLTCNSTISAADSHAVLDVKEIASIANG